MLEASKLQANALATFARRASLSGVSDGWFMRMLDEIIPTVDEDAPTRTANLVDAKRAAVLKAWHDENASLATAHLHADYFLMPRAQRPPDHLRNCFKNCFGQSEVYYKIITL